MKVDPATATESFDHLGTTYYFCCDGCREMFQADPGKYLAKSGAAAQPVTASATVTDPVCGMQVDPQRAAGSHEHTGQRYYFCSKHCLGAFQADPAKYLAPHPRAVEPVA